MTLLWPTRGSPFLRDPTDKESEQGTARPEPGDAVHGQGVLSLGDVETWLPGWTLEGRFCPRPPAKKMGKSVRPSSSTLKLGDGRGCRSTRREPPSEDRLTKGLSFHGASGRWEPGAGCMGWAGQP